MSATEVRIVALGSSTACDDEAGLLVGQRLRDDAGFEVVMAGRPGPGLIDLLDPDVPTVLVDAVAGVEPGRVVVVPLSDLVDAVVAKAPVSSHAVGPAEALRLGRALGRLLPDGVFVGIGGGQWTPGQGRSPAVDPAVREATDVVVEIVRTWS